MFDPFTYWNVFILFSKAVHTPPILKGWRCNQSTLVWWSDSLRWISIIPLLPVWPALQALGKIILVFTYGSGCAARDPSNWALEATFPSETAVMDDASSPDTDTDSWRSEKTHDRWKAVTTPTHRYHRPPPWVRLRRRACTRCAWGSWKGRAAVWEVSELCSDGFGLLQAGVVLKRERPSNFLFFCWLIRCSPCLQLGSWFRSSLTGPFADSFPRKLMTDPIDMPRHPTAHSFPREEAWRVKEMAQMLRQARLDTSFLGHSSSCWCCCCWCRAWLVSCKPMSCGQLAWGGRCSFLRPLGNLEATVLSQRHQGEDLKSAAGQGAITRLVPEKHQALVRRRPQRCRLYCKLGPRRSEGMHTYMRMHMYTYMCRRGALWRSVYFVFIYRTSQTRKPLQ